jgi:hypothetical protein
MMPNKTRNSKRGHSSDGMVGAKIWEKSMYMMKAIINNINDGNYLIKREGSA